MSVVDSKLPDRRPNIVANLRRLWPLLLIILGLNFWWDYYHPLGFFFDVIILIVVLAKPSKRHKSA